MNALLIVGLALGMRHGTDPDHLAAIDGLTRIRPRSTNRIFSHSGTDGRHSARGWDRTISGGAICLSSSWTSILIGMLNLWRLFVTTRTWELLASGCGTASAPGNASRGRLRNFLTVVALILAGETNPWLLGAAFSGGMVLVDGVDGFLAAATQRLAVAGSENARAASRMLGVLVVSFAFGLGGAELAGVDLSRFAFPFGLTLFV